MKTRGLVLEGERALTEPDEFYDMSRFRNDGTSANVTWVRLPSGLWVMSFNGISSVVRINAALPELLPLTAGTVEFWFNHTVIDREALFGVSVTGLNSYYWTILHDAANKIELTVNEAFANILHGTTDNTFTGWMQVVITVNATGNIFYVNGVAQAITYTAGNAASTNFFSGQLDANRVTLGMRDVAPATPNWFTGYMSLVRIYSYALTPGQILQHFEAERRLFGM